jgi:hypothetical protein
MPKKVDECVKSLLEEGYEEDRAWAICKSQFGDSSKRLHFADRVDFDAQDKTAISVRDGVLEYLGSEIGMEPADKVFTVYRSTSTIGNVFPDLVGIPLTDEHVSLDGNAPDTGSSVIDSQMVDLADAGDDARIGIKNKLQVSDAMLDILNTKRQLSLGYSADLVPHDRYDFEQQNIVPHHLAVVENGRCGPLCCFLDKQPGDKIKNLEREKKMKKDFVKKAFYDEDGEISLEQVVEIATNLPEAIKKVPVDKLKELMGPLMEITAYAKEQGVMPAEEPAEGPEMEDEDYEEKEKFEDSQKFKDAVAKAAEKQAEKKAQKLADKEVKKYAGVMAKAKDFLDADYDFGAKSATQIMRDALATQYGDQEFEDSELPTAFKLLKKPAPDYSRFGDSAMPSSLEKRVAEYLDK